MKNVFEWWNGCRRLWQKHLRPCLRQKVFRWVDISNRIEPLVRVASSSMGCFVAFVTAAISLTTLIFAWQNQILLKEQNAPNVMLHMEQEGPRMSVILKNAANTPVNKARFWFEFVRIYNGKSITLSNGHSNLGSLAPNEPAYFPFPIPSNPETNIFLFAIATFSGSQTVLGKPQEVLVTDVRLFDTENGRPRNGWVRIPLTFGTVSEPERSLLRQIVDRIQQDNAKQ